jgi:hypothetical protein
MTARHLNIDDMISTDSFAHASDLSLDLHGFGRRFAGHDPVSG